MNHQPLFSLSRQGVKEVVVYGWVGVLDRDSYVGPGFDVVARSLLKPWQFLATGMTELFDFHAMALASHNGEEVHVKKSNELASHLNLEMKHLDLSPCFPMEPSEAFQLKDKGKDPEKIYHPCVGKHLCYKSASLRAGFSGAYASLENPVFVELKRLTGGERWCLDSCGLPTLICSGRDLLTLYQEFGHTTIQKDIVELWRKNPLLLGGQKRLDSLLVENAPVLAKEGADGLLILKSLDRSISILIKLSHGYHSHHLALALFSIFEKFSELQDAIPHVYNFLQERKHEWIPSDQIFQCEL